HRATGSDDARAKAGAEPPGLALIDTALPGALELCGELASQGIPVLLIAPGDAVSDASRGLTLGARDYLTRPLDPALVQARVASHLALEAQVAARTRALANNLHKLIRRLGRAAEYRDNPSGNHGVRM